VTREQIQQYGRWYFSAHSMLKEKFGRDYKLFAKFLAATSPRKQVLANWRLAHRAYYSYKYCLNGPLSGMLPCHRRNLQRISLGEKLSGQKVSNFYQNLTGNWDAITIDSWTARYFGYSDRLTKKQYKECEKRIKRIARYHHVRNCEVQAAAWCLQILKAGRKVKEFQNVY
jgi:hypothetical protein